MQTRAAIVYTYGDPYQVERVELDEPREREVLVRLAAAGICHSDEHVRVGEMRAQLPLALGHEGAGVVERVGPGVTRCKPGDHIVFSFIPACGHCRYCLMGLSNLCVLQSKTMGGPRLDGTYRMRNAVGSEVGQFCLISTFSEWTVAPEESIVVIDPDVPLDKAALVGCGVSTAFGAVVHRAHVEPGSSAVVVGCGGIGINVVQSLAIAGAGQIIAVDILDTKLEMARTFGATETLNATRDDVPRRVRQLSAGQGADYAFEVTGVASAITQAFAATRKGGTIVLIGISPADQRSIPVPPQELVLLQKTVMGTLYGSAQAANDIPRLLSLYKSGKLKLDELVTRTYTLDEINAGYADLTAGRNLRGVITF
jgi:S-(hydroxymethyl)glutathione dehydrogenase/alcohol dehydrogenase